MLIEYEALLENSNRLVRGQLEAMGERDAIRQLEKKGLVVVDLHEVQERQRSVFRRSVSKQEVLLALFELATLLKSGVSIAEATESQSQSDYHPDIADFFEHVSARLRSGESFAVAVANSKLELPDYLLQLAKSGELSGSLPECLEKGVQQMEYELDIKSQFRSALIYPSVLMLSGLLAVGLIFVLVVPRFGYLLERSDELPWLAVAVLNAGMFFNQFYWVIVPVFVVLIAGLAWSLRKPRVRSRLYEWVGRMPVVGVWIRETEVVRWASMMAALTSSRVDLVSALAMASGGIGLQEMKASLETVVDKIRGGEALSASLVESRVFSATATNLVRVGEKTGAMPEMLSSVARLYDVKCRNRMTVVLALIEPMAILVIGILIGVLVLGIILAITSISTVSI